MPFPYMQLLGVPALRCGACSSHSAAWCPAEVEHCTAAQPALALQASKPASKRTSSPPKAKIHSSCSDCCVFCPAVWLFTAALQLHSSTAQPTGEAAGQLGETAVAASSMRPGGRCICSAEGLMRCPLAALLAAWPGHTLPMADCSSSVCVLGFEAHCCCCPTPQGSRAVGASDAKVCYFSVGHFVPRCRCWVCPCASSCRLLRHAAAAGSCGSCPPGTRSWRAG